jgi:hypothetical protein
MKSLKDNIFDSIFYGNLEAFFFVLFVQTSVAFVVRNPSLNCQAWFQFGHLTTKVAKVLTKVAKRLVHSKRM